MTDMKEQSVDVERSTHAFLAHSKPRPGQLEMIEDGVEALSLSLIHI